MYDVYGVLCETYDEACAVAGIETPAQLAAIDAAEWAEAREGLMDAMEARGGPVVDIPRPFDPDLDIPF